MKKFLIIFLILTTLSIFGIEKNIVSDLDKRSFFDFSILAGGSFSNSDITTGNDRYIKKSYGGLFGLNFGFQYAFSKYFGFGPGISGFLSIVNTETIWYAFLDIDKNNFIKFNSINGFLSGGCLMLNFIIGDLLDKKIAFLLDIGGGWLFCSKIGINIKGFILKFGYQMTVGSLSVTLVPAHNIFIDVGFKLRAKINI